MILARGHEFHLVPAYVTHLVALPVPFTIAALQLRWLSIHHSSSTRNHEDLEKL
jgi:hypothetical protein